MVATERGRQRLATEIRRIGNSSGNPREIIQGGRVNFSSDSRRLLVPPEGRLLFKPDPRLRPTQVILFEDLVSLNIKELELDKELESKIKRSALILDSLSRMEISHRRSALAIYILNETGDRRVVSRTLGIGHGGRIDSLIAHTKDDKGIRSDLGIFEFLTRPNHFEVLKLRRNGVANKEIAGDLRMSRSEVNLISRRLILAGLVIPSHPANVRKAAEYRIFCDSVVELRERGLSNFEIAPLLKVKIGRVVRAVEDLIALGEIEHDDPIKARAKLPKYKKNIILRHKAKRLRLKGAKIAEISQNLSTNKSKTRRLLYSSPDTLRVRQTREMQRTIIIDLLRRNRRRSIRSLQRESKLRASWTTIKSLVDEVESGNLL